MHTWAITIQPISEPLRINTQLPNFKPPVYQDLSRHHDWPVYKSNRRFANQVDRKLETHFR